MRSLIQPILIALLIVASDPAFAQKPTEQEELALTAMEGLMQQSPERALPIIKKVLAGQQSTLIKKRALFVLSQLESPEADEILLQTARSPDQALRREAIRNIGIGGHDKALAGLQQIYTSGDAEMKEQVLHAWMIAGRKQEVYQVAVNAKSEDEAAAAIHMLTVMGAVDELRKLGDRPNAQGSLIEAYAINEDLDSLRKIAEGNADPKLRAEAVRKIGIISNDSARKALREIYSRSPDPKIKSAALEGMLISDDDKGVFELYKVATTPEEKETLLRTLTQMDSDLALDAIDHALEGKQ
jgi:HEAT repeat protein